MRAAPAILLLGLFGVSNAGAAPSLSLDSGLAFTSNADLSQDAPDSDTIVRIGGISRFALGENPGRFVLRYVNYLKHDENDLISANLGTTWAQKESRGNTRPAFGLKASVRNYVHQQAGTTDENFTHYGVIGSATWMRPPSRSGRWELTPQVDLEHYPKYANRNDVDSSFRAEFSGAGAESEFSFSATPGALLSSESDFSRLYLALAADYEQPLDPSSRWGGYLALTPSLYTSRTTGTTTVILARNGRKGSGSATTLQEKEQTLLFAPGIWWSKDLSADWEFRAESLINLQTSRSGTYDYFEFQIGGAIRYQIF